MSREADLGRLYSLLDGLRRRLRGYRYLRDCTGRDGWPWCGVDFFFEDSEVPRGESLRGARLESRGGRLEDLPPR